MGFIHEMVKGDIRAYGSGAAVITDALVTPGQETVEWSVESLTQLEADRLVFTLDAMAPMDKNPIIAKWIAKNFPTIVTMVQKVKHETTSEFRGLKALGQQLTVNMIRPQDVGDTPMNGADTGSKGLYGGTSAQVYVWEQAFTTAGTSEDMIPSQTMAEEAAMIHLGVTDVAAIPKVDGFRWTLAGVAAPHITAPLWQTAKVDDVYPSPLEWPMPVLVGPESTQVLAVEPMVSGGESAPALATILCTRAQDFPL